MIETEVMSSIKIYLLIVHHGLIGFFGVFLMIQMGWFLVFNCKKSFRKK
jgi:hypothetical protein